MKRRKFLVSYGDGTFRPAARRIAAEAVATGEFDGVFSYGRDDVSELVRKCPAFSVPRGAGLWSWKPDIILKALGEISDGDVLVYCDAGCSLYRGSEWKWIWREMDGCDLLVQRIYQKMERWSRAELVQEFKDISFRGLHQFMATVIVAVKSDFTMRFFTEWRRYMSERLELFSDVTPEERLKQPPCLIESRHDQSVFSALAYRCLAKPETRNRILARWEHVENLDVFFSQVIRATRWPGESPYRPSLRDRIASSARRFLKDFIWKPFIACPVQRAAERRNGIL
ncbi:MAG: hypothetical protein IJH50_00675 [Kiritimatiellae bacterium]|nr:hypothetical protein [Kiritimatiellia bacterium]